jgi:hypothetical protein
MFEHLRGYGINQIGLMRSNGALRDFYVGLNARHDDESRNTRIEGLKRLNPLSVGGARFISVFHGDDSHDEIDALDSYAGQFQRLSVSELVSKLPDLATRTFAAPA